MTLYIADPNDEGAKEILRGGAPYLQSIDGPFVPLVWMFGSGVIGTIAILDDNNGLAIFCAIVFAIASLFFLAEVEPITRHRIRRFNRAVASGSIVAVPPVIVESYSQQADRAKLEIAAPDGLPYYFAEVNELFPLVSAITDPNTYKKNRAESRRRIDERMAQIVADIRLRQQQAAEIKRQERDIYNAGIERLNELY